MTQARDVDVFNRRLDAVLGIAGESEAMQEQIGTHTEDLLHIAEALATADFDDELSLLGEERRKIALEERGTGRVRRIIHRRRFAVALTAVILVLVGSFLAIGPERALAAIGRLLGYIPGVGFVDDTQVLRAIPAPVRQDRDGVTLIVEQAVADSERTVIVYMVDGLSLAAADAQGEDAATGSRPWLRMPDGTVINPVEGEARGWGSGYRERLVFPAIPPDVYTVAFEIPRLMNMPAEAAPEDWVVPLTFVAAPSDLTVMPVFEQDATTPPGDTEASGEAGAALQGIELRVDRSVPLDQGFLVEGSLTWDERYRAEQGVADVFDMRLTDSHGREVPIEATRPDAAQEQPYRSAWAYRTAGTALDGPLTFTMDSVSVVPGEPVSFTFDPGPSPKEGQVWELDLQVTVLGYPVHITSARYLVRRGMQGFEFEMQPGPALLSVHLGIAGPDGKPLGSTGGGGSHPTDSGGVISSVLTDGKIDGPATLTVQVVGLRGPWTATWTPPEGEWAGTEPTPIAEACVNPEGGWKPVLPEGAAALPPGLQGQVVGYGPVSGSDRYVVYASNLDGGDLRVIGDGTWPTISPDGAKTAYSAADGINIAENETGGIAHLPGTVEGDYHPLWSPDGSRIAFVRITDLNIYLVNSDGSDLRQMTRGFEYELLAGWSPDGGSLYYTVLSEGGQMLRALDLATGAVRDLFNVGPKDVPSISPDGQKVAFADRVFGEMGYSLFISSLDGSARRRIAESTADHLWSPDGTWLIVSVSDPQDMFAVPMPVLIQVEVCEVIPLPWLTGYVQGWAP